MRKISGIFLISICFFISVTSNSFSSEIKKTYEKTFEMDPGGQVSVQSDEGFIKINSWDKPEVRVVWTKRIWGKTKKDAAKRLEQYKVRFNHSGDRLTIRVIEPKNEGISNFWDLLDPDTWKDHRNSPTIDFELKVPREINLSLTADEGDVSVNSIQGDLDIRVDEGEIRIKDIDFIDMNFYADEGDIFGENLQNKNGRISIEVDEGDVNFNHVITKKFNLECDEGDVTLEEFSSNTSNIITDEGSIDIEMVLNGEDRYDISTDEGNVSIYLEPSPDVQLDLETNDGRIRSDFDIKIKKRNDWQRCRDQLGNGSSLVRIYTDEGFIAIRKY